MAEQADSTSEYVIERGRLLSASPSAGSRLLTDILQIPLPTPASYHEQVSG